MPELRIEDRNELPDPCFFFYFLHEACKDTQQISGISLLAALLLRALDGYLSHEARAFLPLLTQDFRYASGTLCQSLFAATVFWLK